MVQFARPAAAGLMLVLVAGCARSIETPFDDSHAAAAEAQVAPGDATIKGSAFIRKPAGNFATAGGEWVYLIPATPHAEERFRKLFGKDRYNPWPYGARLEKADSRYAAAMHRTKARRDGSFRFENVKAGRWFVATAIVWEPTLWDFHGGMVYEEVTVKAGETAEVILSGK